MAKRIIAVVLSLLFVMAILASCAASNPKALVKKYVKAINNKDFKSFTECYDPETRKELKDTLTKEDFVKYYCDGKYSVKIKGVEYSDDKATATVSVTLTKDGETQDLELTCAKVDGKWYIGY
ncbi:MAG: DUF4878 domain-containing protein [Clostridia bacterium]|nr:DUF4878 domain-containing protein [Clostridia bacterium]